MSWQRANGQRRRALLAHESSFLHSIIDIRAFIPLCICFMLFERAVEWPSFLLLLPFEASIILAFKSLHPLNELMGDFRGLGPIQWLVVHFLIRTNNVY